MTIPRRPPGSPVPLTPAQSRLWVLDGAGFGDGAYLCWISRRYRGPLDPAVLDRALHALVDRHEALRTAVVTTASGPVQVVSAQVGSGLVEHVDLTGAPGAVDEARRISEAFVARPLPLDRAPLHRALLVRLAPDDHVLLWCLHHIVCDGSSAGLLEEELFALVRSEDLGPAPVQFPDYAAWLAGPGPADAPGAADGVEYWRRQLAGAPAVQSLPSDRARPDAPSTRGAHCGTELPAELSRALLATGRRERCTPFVLFLAAMAAVLSRHSGEQDVVVGAPVSERDRTDLERSVGFYVNTLPFRADLAPDPTLRGLLRQVRTTLLEGLAHQAVPFDEIVRAAGTSRDPARNPLFQTMLVLGHGVPSSPADGLAGEEWPLPAPTARLDLTLVVSLGERIGLYCDYAADLFAPGQVERFHDHVVRVLEAMTTDLEQRVSQVPILDAAECATLLGSGDPTPAGPPVLDLWAGLVAAQPDAPAVVAAGRTVTYGELDRLAENVAGRLVGASLVGIVLPTGIDAVAAVLGALRAGAAYLPLSPADPQARTEELLRGAGADHVVTAQGTMHRADAHADRPAGLAYVIYTSGSTGRPKGVLVGHRTLASFTASFRDAHRFGPGDRILMLPPLTFDASVGDLFPALTSGAALVLHPEPARLDAAELVAFCARHGVTAVDAPAALWRRWVDDLASGTVVAPADWPVRMMMVGGERVATDAVRAWARATGERIAFVNHYGPTEATVCATVHETVDGAESTGPHLPIGRPLPHVRAYVLDATGGLAPPGAPGDLVLAGDCLALGYLGDPEATAAAFGPDPFHGGRAYRTGDLARWRHDGTLEFLGRVDRQVKIRGHRVEPGEVEFALTAHPEVRDAVAVAAGDRLVAYAATTTAAPAELRRFARDRLPRHLVPDLVVTVDRIPRTAHEKVDLAALPPATAEPAAHVPPRGPVETAIAAVWAQLLAAPRVGRTDDFFALGGSSLVAARMVGALETALGRPVPVSALLGSDDLAGLARALEAPPAAGPDLLADRLPAELVPFVPRQGPVRTVLVTGATGFLGAHVVAALLAHSAVTVACLVRAGSPQRAHDRVVQALLAHGLDGDAARIEGVPGDLALPRFGLPEHAWRELARRCDVVCHNGGVVHFAAPYERLHPANVGGTLEALRLAALAGAPLHAVSTLGVFLGTAHRGTRVTERDAPGPPDGLSGAYEQTKWVADRLCREARDAGMAVTLHRPARIGGHGVTGRANPEDYFSRLLTTFVQTGCVPDLAHTEDVWPVDHLARGIARLLLAPAGADRHYFNAATISYPELAAAVADRGHPVELVPWARWREVVGGRLAAGAPLALAPFLGALPERAPQFPRPQFDCTATEAEVGTPPPADRALIGRYLDVLVPAGVRA